MKEYQYYLLDWDGNLAQTLDIWLAAYRISLDRRGFTSVMDEQIGASFGATKEHMSEWGVEDPELAVNEANAIAKKQLPQAILYPDAIEVIGELYRRGKDLALITSSPHENIAHLLDKHGLREFFRVIVAGDDVEQYKPHPESLEKAIAQMGGRKERAVMIGDSDKDLGAANNYGVDSVLFYPPEHKKFYDFEKLKALNPTYIIEDFRTILY